MRIEGGVFLVTGGGRRLGRAIALGLAERGGSVVAHYGGSQRGAEETAEAIRDLGGDAWTVQADLRSAEAGEELASAVESGPGRLDGLINSAASFVSGSLEEIDAEAWDGILAVNLRAPYLLSRSLAAILSRNGKQRGAPAAIVNMADLSGLHPWRGYAVHGVSKAGLLHLTRTLARELAPEIRVNAVVPGAILPAPGTDAESSNWRDWGRRLPLQRTGDPEDVVSAITFLLESNFVTGAALPVDGGEDLIGVQARRHPGPGEEG